MNASLTKIALPLSAAMVTSFVYTSNALAQTTSGFAGPSPDIQGTPSAADSTEIRQIIIDVLTAVLNFLALIAVIVVVIAGIRMIISQGEEEPMGKAKKTIFYALIGLVIVLFARVIVGLVTTYLADEVVN